MGIRMIEATEVSCQQCDATVLVKHWRDARHSGWVVPTDGQLHLCPDCAQARIDEVFAAAVPSTESARAGKET